MIGRDDAAGRQRTREPFDRVTGSHADAPRLIAGFLSIWLQVGYVSLRVGILVQVAVASIDWLGLGRRRSVRPRSQSPGPTQLVLLRYQFLTVRRTPRTLILGGWTGGHPLADRRASVRPSGSPASAVAGKPCWCCSLWTRANLALMLAIAALVTAERMARAGLPIGQATGAVLLSPAVAVAA